MTETGAKINDGSTKESSILEDFYLHPSSDPGNLISTVLLNGSNYERWAKLLRNALRAKNKLGFIDGTVTRPKSGANELKLWGIVNSMLVAWILNTIEPKLRTSVSCYDTAFLLWESIRERFSVGNEPHIYELKASAAACKQENLSVQDYFGKIKLLWDDIEDYEPLSECCCGDSNCKVNKELRSKREREQKYQFLMGLDGSRYGTTRSNILCMTPPTSLASTFSMILQEERHQNVTRVADVRTDMVGFSAQAQANAISTPRNRTPIVCSYCGRNGHPVKDCFQLHGFPDSRGDNNGGRGRGGSTMNGGRNGGRGGWNNMGGRGRGRVAANNAQFTAHEPSSQVYNLQSSDGDGLTLNKDQWNALVNILKTPPQGSNDRLSGIIIDTGASHHLTGNLGLLFDTKDIVHCPIELPNGDLTMATKRGRMCIGGSVIISAVYYVPKLTNTLLSVARLLREKTCIAVFTDKFCYMQDRSSRILIGAGIECDGIYYFREVFSFQANSAGRLSGRELWHRRLGHPAKSVLSSLADFVDLSGVNSHENEPCDICVRAKHPRLSFPDSDNKATEIFSLIHCDVWGPYNTPATCGSVYFLTIVDDYSRAVWVFLMRHKSEVSSFIQQFCALAERQFQHKVRMVRSDNGTEFMCLRSYFASQGILHQTSCVGTPQQNGRVERKHRHILNVARSLRFQASLPIEFWGECVLAASYLINRTPSSILDGKTPYELLFGQAPAYDYIRIFGCLCYAHKGTRSRDKFDERATRCVFLGYPYSQKGWRVYDLDRKEFFVSRDVVFNEAVFPFAIASLPPETLSTSQPTHVSVSPCIDDDDDAPIVHPIDPPLAEPNMMDRGSSSTIDVPLLVEQESHIVEPIDSAPTQLVSSDTTVVPSAVPEVTLGRGQREKQKSVLLKPYVTYTTRCLDSPSHSSHSTLQSPPGPSGTPYPLANYISCTRFSERFQAFLAKLSVEEIPRSFAEAMSRPEFRDAMKMEIQALEDNCTWLLTDLPPNKKAIGTQWIYTIKYNSDGTIARYKARLVALGNRQEEGLDYDETFAPVIKMTTVRAFFKVAAARKWELHQMDVHNAFLHGDLDEEVYVRLPQGFSQSAPNKVCKLLKSLYGLKQAPRCWFSTLQKALERYGFKQSRSDYSLFSLVNGSNELYVLVYVDDLVIGGNDPKMIATFKEYLSSCFHMKDLGALRYFLGIEVARQDEGIFLCQRKYCLDIITECGLLGSRPAITPMEQNHNLATASDELFADPAKYRRIVGRLIYLHITRPELSYAVHILSQFMQAPRISQWESALRVVRYLKGTPGQGIFLSAYSDLRLSGYCDSDWAACPTTRRSLSSYIFLLGGSPISWKTTKQRTVSRSSAEAEYRSMADANCDIKWLRELLQFFNASPTQPVPIYCDSQSALHLASNPVQHQRTKHIENDCHFIRDDVVAGLIKPLYISTKEQPADLLTKPLGRLQFETFLVKLGIRNLHAPT